MTLMTSVRGTSSKHDKHAQHREHHAKERRTLHQGLSLGPHGSRVVDGGVTATGVLYRGGVNGYSHLLNGSVEACLQPPRVGDASVSDAQ